MPPSFHIEALREAHAAPAALVHRAAFAASWSVEEIVRLSAPPAGIGWGAWREGALLGFILLAVTLDEAEIVTLAVAPKHRRIGIGAALLAEAARHCAQSDVRALFLEVAEANDAARALYEVSGFAQVGLRKGYYPRPEGAANALVLRRDLSPAGFQGG
jgi:ribosomal-protein-alanine acetyltransferase